MHSPLKGLSLFKRVTFNFSTWLLFFLLFSQIYSEEAKKDAPPQEQGKEALGFNSLFSGKRDASSDFQKKPALLDKKFESSSATFGKEARGFDRKFETSESSFKKSFPLEPKSFTVKSSDLAKTSPFDKKESTLSQKGSAGFEKTFETKAYTGPESPQTSTEIRDLLKQKGGVSTSGDQPLSIQEVKDIVNRDRHTTTPESSPVEAPKTTPRGPLPSPR